jgi:hypothetical protein
VRLGRPAGCRTAPGVAPDAPLIVIEITVDLVALTAHGVCDSVRDRRLCGACKSEQPRRVGCGIPAAEPATGGAVVWFMRLLLRGSGSVAVDWVLYPSRVGPPSSQPNSDSLGRLERLEQVRRERVIRRLGFTSCEVQLDSPQALQMLLTLFQVHGNRERCRAYCQLQAHGCSCMSPTDEQTRPIADQPRVVERIGVMITRTTLLWRTTGGIRTAS